MYRYWKTTEVSVLKENIKSMPLDDLALKLNRTKSSLVAFITKTIFIIKRLGLKKMLIMLLKTKTIPTQNLQNILT